MHRSIKAIGVSAVLAATVGCASMSNAPPPAPSPRAACAPAEATIYFTEDSATLQPLSTPLLQDLLDRAGACRAEGGELRAITITAYADPGARRSEADAQVQTRGARISAKLVELGARESDIHIRRGGRSNRGSIMARRAEVAIDLY